MKSISFPKMFNPTSTRIVKDLDMTKQNLNLVLLSEKGELFGDPYFGLRLKRYLFEQNDYILKDIIIDEIYTQLALFVPQIKVNRSDIEITQDENKGKLYCHIKAKNLIDFTNSVYDLVLFDEEGR